MTGDGPRLELVEWVDSCSPVNSWTLLGELDDLEADGIRTVGWVLRETEASVVLASSLATDSATGIMAIPKVAITRRQAIGPRKTRGPGRRPDAP